MCKQILLTALQKLHLNNSFEHLQRMGIYFGPGTAKRAKTNTKKSWDVSTWVISSTLCFFKKALKEKWKKLMSDSFSQILLELPGKGRLSGQK